MIIQLKKKKEPSNEVSIQTFEILLYYQRTYRVDKYWTPTQIDIMIEHLNSELTISFTFIDKFESSYHMKHFISSKLVLNYHRR